MIRHRCTQIHQLEEQECLGASIPFRGGMQEPHFPSAQQFESLFSERLRRTRRAKREYVTHACKAFLCGISCTQTHRVDSTGAAVSVSWGRYFLEPNQRQFLPSENTESEREHGTQMRIFNRVAFKITKRERDKRDLKTINSFRTYRVYRTIETVNLIDHYLGIALFFDWRWGTKPAN